MDNGAPFDKPHYGNQKAGSVVIVDVFTRQSAVMQRTGFQESGLQGGRLLVQGFRNTGDVSGEFFPGIWYEYGQGGLKDHA